MEMRKCVTAFAAIVAAATISTAAFAKHQDQNGPFVIQGFGVGKCARFNEDITKHPRWIEDYHTWAQGMISGFNFISFKQSDYYKDMHSIDVRDQKKILVKYCLAHPQEDFYDAVDELYGQLERREYNHEESRVD